MLEVVVNQMFALGCNFTSSDMYSNNACVVLRQASVCTAGVLYAWYNTIMVQHLQNGRASGPCERFVKGQTLCRSAFPTGNWVEAGRYDEYSMSLCERVYVE